MSELAVRSRSKFRPALNTADTQDCLVPVAEGLASRIPAFKKRVPEILRALHDALEGSDRQSIEMRMMLQMHLVRVSNCLMLQAAAEDEKMISTEQAASMMKCSRPYVAMLVDRGKLTGAVKTRGGHRKIPLSSVQAWLEENVANNAASADYRAAASEAGMYDVPEQTYTKVLRRKKGSKSA